MTKKINIGGQAVIEGVMMQSSKSLAIAVRKQDGEIIVKENTWQSLSNKFKFLKWPFLRGTLVLIETLINGLQALTFSANQALDEGEGEESLGSWALALTIAFALGLGILIFIVLPHFLTIFLGKMVNLDLTVDTFSFHLIDGIIKIVFFISYIWLISLWKDIQIIFQYHGAEHKTIYTYEANEELTLENARKYTTLHPRCGTAFILVVFMISILFFAVIFPMLPKFTSLPGILSKLLLVFIKIPLMLPIAGISYEITKLAGKKRDNRILRAIIAPGLYLQKLTTKEPTDDQLEVALMALRGVLKMEETG